MGVLTEFWRRRRRLEDGGGMKERCRSTSVGFYGGIVSNFFDVSSGIPPCSKISFLISPSLFFTPAQRSSLSHLTAGKSIIWALERRTANVHLLYQEKGSLERPEGAPLSLFTGYSQCSNECRWSESYHYESTPKMLHLSSHSHHVHNFTAYAWLS